MTKIIELAMKRRNTKLIGFKQKVIIIIMK